MFDLAHNYIGSLINSNIINNTKLSTSYGFIYDNGMTLFNFNNSIFIKNFYLIFRTHNSGIINFNNCLFYDTILPPNINSINFYPNSLNINHFQDGYCLKNLIISKIKKNYYINFLFFYNFLL